MLDHLDVNVSDLSRSRVFYEPLLQRIGYRPFESGAGWCSYAEPGGLSYLVLVQTSPRHLTAGFHRKRVGLNHLAFRAPSRADVDALHSWLVGQGTTILYDGPLAMDDRYAVFFEDPDRLKLEFVWRPETG